MLAGTGINAHSQNGLGQGQTQPQPQQAEFPIPPAYTDNQDYYAPIDLLWQGSIDQWLQQRSQLLVSKSKTNAIECESSKLAGYAGIGFAAIISTNPLAWIPLAVSGLGLLYTFFQERQDIGHIHPFPLYRGSIGDLLQIAGGGKGQGFDPMMDRVAYLSLVEQDEYTFILEHFGYLSAALNQVPPGVRFDLYCHLVDQYCYHSALVDRQGIVDYVEQATSIDRRNFMANAPATATHTALPQADALYLPGVPIPAPVSPAPTFTPNASPMPHAQLTSDAQGQIANSALPVSPMATVVTQSKANPPNASPPTPVSPQTQPQAQASAMSKPPIWVDGDPNPQLMALPLEQRAKYLFARMRSDGFPLDKLICSQVVAICGNQRGGKGTLAGIAAIIQQALPKAANDNRTVVRYFTAGTDLYPFKTDECVSALNYPGSDIADAEVAQELLVRLKQYEKFVNYECKGEIVIIDETIALSDTLTDSEKRWMITYLLNRFAKSGASAIIILHSDKLTSWTGTGNTAGMASSFRSGVTRIGCKTKTVSGNGILSMNVASGEYFLADAEEFTKPCEGSPQAKIPDWLLHEHHPGNGAPDPVRSLLRLLPEMETGVAIILNEPLELEAEDFTPQETFIDLTGEEIADFEAQEDFIDLTLPTPPATPSTIAQPNPAPVQTVRHAASKVLSSSPKTASSTKAESDAADRVIQLFQKIEKLLTTKREVTGRKFAQANKLNAEEIRQLFSMYAHRNKDFCEYIEIDRGNGQVSRVLRLINK